MAETNVGTGLAKMAETKRVLAASTGVAREPAEIARIFENAQQMGHFVGSQTIAPRPPEGCAVTVSGVLVDQEEIAELLKPRQGYVPFQVYKETYAIPGGSKVGLGKVVLDKIAAAAGISWGGPREGRLDDGSDPHYCHYRAVGSFRDLTGQPRTIEADKEIDLRDGSALAEEMRANAKRKEDKKDEGRKTGDLDGQLRQSRLNILSLAQSKARNRAVRALGLRTSYEPKDLLKPFLVARIAFTGQTEDPELRRRFAEMNAASMMMGTQALYGPAPAAALTLKEPPPVQTRLEEDDAAGGDPLPGSVETSKVPAGPVRAESASTVIYQGKGQPQKPIAETSDEVLNKYASYLDGCLQSGRIPTGLTKDAAETVLGACLADMDYRKALKATAEPNF